MPATPPLLRGERDCLLKITLWDKLVRCQCNGNSVINLCLSQALFLESLELYHHFRCTEKVYLAGLLTYSLFETSFPFLSEQWIE
jgi:hypothetical protein